MWGGGEECGGGVEDVVDVPALSARRREAVAACVPVCATAPLSTGMIGTSMTTTGGASSHQYQGIFSDEADSKWCS